MATSSSLYPKIKEYSASIASILMACAACATAISVYLRPPDSKKYETELSALQNRVSQLNVQLYESTLKVNSMLEWKTKLESDARVDAELYRSEEIIVYKQLSKKYGHSIAKSVLEYRKKIEENKHKD